MPYLSVPTHPHPHLHVGAWQALEAESDLLPVAIAHPAEAALLGQIKVPAKRLEHLAARAALRQAAFISTEDLLGRGPKGEPFLQPGHACVSLSHTHLLGFGAAHPELPVAIDAEPLGRVIHPRMLHLFLNPTERAYYEKIKDNRYLLYVWTAKEALYKLFSPRLEAISFSRELWTDPASLLGPKPLAGIHRPEVAAAFMMNYTMVADALVCWVLDARGESLVGV